MPPRRITILFITVLLLLFMQVNGAQPTLAAGPNHVTISGSHGPTPLGSATLCSMPNGSRIGLLSATETAGPDYLHDFEFVPGVGTLSDGINYTDNYAPNHVFTSWGYDIKGAGYSVPANTPITVYTLAYTDATFSKPFYIAQMTFNCTTGVVLSVYNGPYPIAGSAAGACPIFFDGRLNNCDAAETAAIYCLPDGSVKVLAIYQGKGYDAILVSPDEIKAVPTKPAKNTAIKTGNGATLYRLMSGELQVNRAEDGTGKIYKFIFQDCPKP